MLVLITRPKQQSQPLANKLHEFGFDVLFEPLIQIEPIVDSQALQNLRTVVSAVFDDTITSVDGLRYHWLVFSSPNGVSTFYELCEKFLSATDVSSLNCNIRIAVVGPGTADEFSMRWRLPPVTVFSQSGNAEDMVEQMTTRFDVKDKRILILRGDKGRKVIAETLTGCGAIVEEHAIYRTTAVQDVASETKAKLHNGEIDFVTVTSSSIADVLVKCFGDDLRRTNLVSISPLTSQRLSEQGFPPKYEAKEATIDSVLECITHHSPMPSQHSRESEANAFLASLVNLETVVHFDYAALGDKLETLRRILTALGNPEKRFVTVHVAGSKGKGSVCAMVDNTLRLAGYRTGCFTSPHIDSVTERVMIDGNSITMDVFVDEILRLKTFLQSRGDTKLLSYFDILTLAAITIFARQNIDAAILEVGMGGLYDSTNVCTPTVSAITEIELEHTEYLGDTIEKISAQKAGIIRSNVPAVIAQPNINLSPEQLNAILPKNSILIPPSIQTVENLRLNMPGRHQTRNAAIAAAILEQLRDNGGMKKLTTEVIRDGIATTRVPLRIEQLSKKPTLIIDAAHTVKSTKSLLEVLSENRTYEQKTLLLGLMRDKNVEGILDILLPFFNKTIFTRPSESARALTGKELAEKANAKQYEIIEDPITAFKTIWQNAKPNDLVCVTGSFYLGAVVRRWFVDNGNGL